MAMAWLRLVLLAALSIPLAAQASSAGEIVVSGAASLTGALTEIKEAFEVAHPDCKVFVNFAASGPLLQQVQAGAPVDVITAADQETMDRAQKQGLIDPATRMNFTANDLMLVVPSNSSLISNPKDLTNPKVGRVALGEPDTVPAGSYTKESLSRLGFWDRLEPKMVYGLSVKQALDYVALGEVDAAFVYATDARLARERVRVIATMEGHRPIVYPVAVVTASVHKDAAREFISFLCSEPGQTILARNGFKKAH